MSNPDYVFFYARQVDVEVLERGEVFGDQQEAFGLLVPGALGEQLVRVRQRIGERLAPQQPVHQHREHPGGQVAAGLRAGQRGGRGGELAAALCGSGCDPECGGPPVGGTNHIYWKFQNLSGEEEVTMTYDMCMKALNTEASACSRGSEQNHEGFFYIIDPNEGSCPPLTGKLYGSR